MNQDVNSQKNVKLILNVKPTISKNIYCLATVLTDSSNNSLTNYLRRGIQVTRSLLKRKRIKISKKWKRAKCNKFAYGFSILRFILFSNILVS